VAIALAEAFFLFFPRPKKITVTKEKIVVTREKVKEKEMAVSREILPKPIAGHIAIIVDDCGYNLQPCEYSQKIKSPVTFSVLPNLQHSTDVAKCIHKNGKEVMLHLPMEPHYNEDKYPENYLIKTSMSKAKIENILTKSLESVPLAAGVNNHMGSKVTEDTRAMTIVFDGLKNRRLFFIDSLVTNNSVCQAIAKSKALPFGKRGIFLDNENNRDYIEHQFELLAREARAKGYVIAIGHDRTLTLQIIQEQIQRLEKEGFKIITVGELIKQR